MSEKSGYKQQRNLSSVQLLTETPFFIANLLSALFSGTILIYVDLMDSLNYIIRNAMVILLSNKLSKDLRYEYNYGVGKIEAISSIFGDGIVLFGMFLTLCVSVGSLFYPSQPTEFLIAAVGLKFYDIIWSVAFFSKQRKIRKEHPSPLSETNYAAAFGDLLFDSFAGVSLFAMWILRNTPVVGYVSPVISILVAGYLIVGCIKRIKVSLNELTDKTLPEEQQLEILKLLTKHFDSYTQVYTIDSRKIGDITRIDINLSFEANTKVEDVINLQKQMQEELGKKIDNCYVKITMGEDKISSGDTNDMTIE